MEAAPEIEWQRLDPRQLMIDPVKVIGQFAFPAAVALFGVSQREGGTPLWMIPLVLVGAIALGAVPWLTTYFRVTDTQFQLRTGLLNKQTKTAPLDRVRSVDLEANILHRLLGLTRVKIGTGVDDEQITLDSVSRERAHDLRAQLLSRRTTTTPAQPVTAPGHEPGDVVTDTIIPATETEELAAIDWSWVRFAPFSLSRLVVLAGAVGALAQFGDGLPIDDYAASAWGWLTQFALILLIPALIVSGLVGWVTTAVTAYVVQWWNLRLTREAGSLHMNAGLFTTRATSVEEKRVRGVELTEPVLMRLVGGAELSALATGREEGAAKLLPPCPVSVATDVAARILESDEPMRVPLTRHGRAARRRSWIQHGWGALFFLACIWVAQIWLPIPLWLSITATLVILALTAAVAEASYRHLGHALTAEHLVIGSGETSRIRTALEYDGIIGWVFHQSFFQRRLGLADLIATTAAGAERVVAHDISLARGIAVADASTPGVLSEFIKPSPAAARLDT